MKNKIKKFENFSLKESKDVIKKHIDIDKLLKVAESITVLCNGEDGNIWFKEDENKIFISLGDSNPFEEEMLEMFIKQSISKSYKVEDEIDIEIDYECYPDNKDSWKIYNKGKFK